MELSLKLYHVWELRSRCQQSTAEAPRLTKLQNKKSGLREVAGLKQTNAVLFFSIRFLIRPDLYPSFCSSAPSPDPAPSATPPQPPPLPPPSKTVHPISLSPSANNARLLLSWLVVKPHRCMSPCVLLDLRERLEPPQLDTAIRRKSVRKTYSADSHSPAEQISRFPIICGHTEAAFRYKAVGELYIWIDST